MSTDKIPWTLLKRVFQAFNYGFVKTYVCENRFTSCEIYLPRAPDAKRIMKTEYLTVGLKIDMKRNPGGTQEAKTDLTAADMMRDTMRTTDTVTDTYR